MTAPTVASGPAVVVPNPYGPPGGTPDLDVIIVNYRTPALLRRCLDSWEQYRQAHEAAGVHVRLTVVDVDPEPGQDGVTSIEREGVRAELAGSTRAGVQWLQLPWNAGYSGACNRAALITDAPILSFWNADTRLIDADAIPTMMAFFAENEHYHIAGPLQIDDQQLVRHGGIFGGHAAPQHRDFGHPVTDAHRDVRPAITVSGSAYFIRRDWWNKLRDCPLFQEEIDPGNPGAMLRTPHYFEETWVSYHAHGHAGRVAYVGTACVEHLFDRSPHDDVADTSRLFHASKPIFVRACDLHRIKHD